MSNFPIISCSNQIICRYYETFCILQVKRPSTTPPNLVPPSSTTPTKRPPRSPSRTPPSSPSKLSSPSPTCSQAQPRGVDYYEFVLFLFVQLFLTSETFKSSRTTSSPNILNKKDNGISSPSHPHKDSLRLQLSWTTKHLPDIFKLLSGRESDSLTRYILHSTPHHPIHTLSQRQR